MSIHDAYSIEANPKEAEVQDRQHEFSSGITFYRQALVVSQFGRLASGELKK